MVSRFFPVALARGKHLFPFRTEKLSPSAPMVLGSQGPGRVGRRRFLHTGRPHGRPVCVLGWLAGVLRFRPREPEVLATLDHRPSRLARAEPLVPRARRVSGRVGVRDRRPPAGERRQRAQAHLLACHHGSWTPRNALNAQRCPVRVIAGRRRPPRLRRCASSAEVPVPVDLPVDVVVVLEQQERADQLQRSVESLLRSRRVRRGEHVFVL